MDQVNKEAANYPKLAEKGEYSVKFLLLLANLLMIQEKTNRSDAYMFKELLHKLKNHKNIFEIVSTASHTRTRWMEYYGPDLPFWKMVLLPPISYFRWSECSKRTYAHDSET